MDSQEQQKAESVLVSNPYVLRSKCGLCQTIHPNVNDENNNFKKDNNTDEKSFHSISKLRSSKCSDCEAKIRLEEKQTKSSSTVTSQGLEEESDRMIIVPDTSSDDNDDECWCQSCKDIEHDVNYRQLWDDLSHIIKCVYRATDKEFSENHFSNDICKAKEYVKKLTEINSQSLFNKLESIVLEYVREIRNQVLERFHTCSKTSHDVQLFISFLLDEYQMFIQAATNVSIIVAYLEEKYMKNFNLTWLLYNKNLYEKLIYMDKKIQHSISTIIDLLQPSNNDNNDYSTAEYAQLLNRFLAFDEEMSEIACLYKDSQEKMISLPFNVCIHNGCSIGNNINSKKKKKCKKNPKSNTLQTSTQENNPNNSTRNAVDIPSSNPSSSTNIPPQEGSNSSSIGSGIGGDESSSISSVDDYLLDNDTSSSGYTQEEQEELARLITEEDLNELLLEGILDSVSPFARLQHELYQTRLDEKQISSTILDDEQWIGGIFQGPRSTQGKEQKKTNPVTTNIQLNKERTSNETFFEKSNKKSSPTKSKSSKTSHRRKETQSSNHPAAAATTTTTTTTTHLPKKTIAPDLILPRSIADISAKIQSVSFTAGTFGSITSTNSTDYRNLSSSSSSSSNCSTTTLTAAKTTTSTGQTRLSINLTRKSGPKSIEHGGQKIAEALYNELTNFGNSECSSSGRKKENQQFKKSRQQRSTINETLNNSPNNSHSFLNSSNKSDPNSSSTASNNLDYLLRHAASNTDVTDAALHSLLSSFHSPTCLDSSPKHSTSSKTTEALQTLLAQQHHHHHHHHHHQHQKKNLSNNNPKHCEFCCCEFSEGRNCPTSACLHLSSTSNLSNGPIASCVTCMTLPGTTTTASVMGATITGAFNSRDVEVKERLKLKLNKRIEQNSTEPQISSKKNSTTNKKQSAQNNSKQKESLINDKNDIDDLVRFIDGDETLISTNNDNQTNSTTTTTTTNESTSKKNKKKKDKQSKTNNNEDTKTNQKKQNQPTTTQQTTSSQQPSPSASSTAKPVSNPSSVPTVETPTTVSKRKRKAKLKLEQQQQQEEEENKLDESETISKTNVMTITPTSATTTSSVTVPSSISSPNTSKIQTPVEQSFKHFDSLEEEEVNWITISRKQSKHKPTPATVPSLLATPVPPVVPPANTKQHRPQSMATNTKKPTTTNSSSLAQQKLIPSTTVTSSAASDTISNMNKQPHTITAPHRLQNVLKNHSSHQTQKVEPIVQPSINLWTNNNTNNNNIHEHNPVITPPVASSILPPTTIQPTASVYVPTHTPPSSSVVTPTHIIGSSSYSSSSSNLSENLPSSIYWEPNDYLLPPLPQSGIMPSTVPGPVQRPNPSFSPAPGTVTATTSRCIQRPSPEPRSCSTNSVPFPLYSPMNYAVGSSTSTWNDISRTNSHESQWSYPKEQQIGSSSISTDFPLYDPFHSGAGLTIPSTTQTTLLTNGFSEQFADLYAIPNDNDINEMDALDKEIEDFKKFCFENVPLETREKVQVHADRCFVRQA